MSKTSDLFDKATDAHDEQSWRDVAELFIKNKCGVVNLVDYVNKAAPYTKDNTDWVMRAELFETAMYIMSVVREHEKGNI